MKKNNQKPKSKKSPKKNVKSTATVASTSEGSVKAVQPDAKPARVVQKRAKAAKSGESGASNVFKTVGLFLRQAKVELKKVKWPTRKELIASTVVVIVLTILISFYLGLVDLGLIKIIKHVIG
ncbi:MAG TPA: preprotein translocase subunit SecE [Desulfobacteria bacterium]|nr:preprotein translocase subunit SecE [Desulfobacteria bacterium]